MAISSATDAIAAKVASVSGWRANIAITPTSRSSTTSGYPAKATMPSSLSPLLVAHTGVAHDGVRQVGLPLLGDQADLVLADRNPAVRPVQVRVHPGAGPQFQNGICLVEHPDAGERPAQVLHQRHGATVEHRPQVIRLNQRLPDCRIQGEEAHPFGQRRLVPLAFGDVPEDQHAAGDVASLIPNRGRTVVDRAFGPVLGRSARCGCASPTIVPS